MSKLRRPLCLPEFAKTGTIWDVYLSRVRKVERHQPGDTVRVAGTSNIGHNMQTKYTCPACGTRTNSIRCPACGQDTDEADDTPRTPHPAETAAALQQEGIDRAAAAARGTYTIFDHAQGAPQCR